MATTLYIRAPIPALWAGVNAIFTFKDAGRAVTVGATTVEGADRNVSSLRSLSTSIGALGEVRDAVTVAGPTAGIPIISDFPDIHFSPPLAADITISGTVTFKINALENSMSANATIRIAIYKVDEEGAFTLIVDSSFGTELGTTNALKTWTATPTSTLVKKGQRLALFKIADDATAATMGGGFGASVVEEGTLAQVADTRIELTETLTFLTTDPTGTTLYLRDTASDLGGISKLLGLVQGSGTAVATHTTLTGPLTFPGDLWTATAGGADIDWVTKPLNSFTLGGAVKATVDNDGTQLEQRTTPFDCMVMELAVVDADGTNPVIWARSYTGMADASGAKVHYLTGPDLSVAQGKRLRFRVYSDDMRPLGNQVAATSRNFRYDGTSTYAATLLFTQTITEAVAAVPLIPPVHINQAIFRASYR